MRKVVPVTFLGALLLAVAGCGTPARWEKPGVSTEMTSIDAVDCRRAASMESFLSTPYVTPPVYRPNWLQMRESERFYAENRLTAFCMRNKSYELMPIPKTPG
jgi:hypothetical protein